MNKIITLSIAVSLSIISAGAWADDMIDECDNCHGKDGISEDGKVPTIAGMSAQYIIDTFTGYLSGDRPAIKYKPSSGDETDMAEVARKLSEKDIQKLADFYAGKPFKVSEQPFNADMAAKGKEVFDKQCEKCHTEGGAVAADDAGILLGQWKPYLVEQFELYSSGDRVMSKKMKKKYEKVSEEDIANMIEFLASGKN